MPVGEIKIMLLLLEHILTIIILLFAILQSHQHWESYCTQSTHPPPIRLIIPIQIEEEADLSTGTNTLD